MYAPMAIAITQPKVLVVEDDGSMREAIERLLNVAGFQPVAYSSGEALLAGGRAEDAAGTDLLADYDEGERVNRKLFDIAYDGPRLWLNEPFRLYL